MRSSIRFAFAAALLISFSCASSAQLGSPADPEALVKKIQDELSGPVLDDGKPNTQVPHGELLQGTISDSAIYPGTENRFQVYVPAEYNPRVPACLLLKLDGFGDYEATVLDNLIAKQEVPIIIGVGVVPGAIWKDPIGTTKRRALRFNRSFEFDSMNDQFPDYVLNELLPAVQKLKTHDGRAILLSSEGNSHAAMGASTGGIGSFTLAWRRPDQFTRVYSEIGTFVSMRGGNEYPVLVRKTEPKALRIFLEDGSTDAWNPLFGSWYEANLNLESALKFSGYDVAHAWGTHGHDGHPGQVILPDVMRWLWRDYPAPIKAGRSKNSTLEELTLPGEGWQQIGQSFQQAAALAANGTGDVFFSDLSAKTILRLGANDNVNIFLKGLRLSGLAFSPDGKLYALNGEKKEVLQVNENGSSRVLAKGIFGHALIATPAGTLYVSEPGAHPDLPSRLWSLTRGRETRVIDKGLRSVSGIAFSPDRTLFYAAENTTRWIYSYVVQPDGSLSDKQRFYWLHVADIAPDSGAEDLATDTHGNLYVATRMGIQICDQNGRVRAILPLPAPGGSVRSLCFGGSQFQFLYATDGIHLFKRRLKVPGLAPWAAPITFPSQGAG